MNPKSWHITLPHALAATFGFAACAGAWFDWRLEGPQEHRLMPFALPLGFLMVGGPFVGLGTLLGRPAVGVLLGLLSFGGLILWMNR